MEFDHWSNADAIAEVKAGGYVNLDKEDDVRTYLEDYQPSWRKNPQTSSLLNLQIE
jgi:hypothetical protein